MLLDLFASMSIHATLPCNIPTNIFLLRRQKTNTLQIAVMLCGNVTILHFGVTLPSTHVHTGILVRNFVQVWTNLKPGTHMWTKCTYVWMGLRTCAAASANRLHTICQEPKFIWVLRKHKGNWVSQEALGVLCSPQVRRKLIYHTPSANCFGTI